MSLSIQCPEYAVNMYLKGWTHQKVPTFDIATTKVLSAVCVTLRLRFTCAGNLAVV